MWIFRVNWLSQIYRIYLKFLMKMIFCVKGARLNHPLTPTHPQTRSESSPKLQVLHWSVFVVHLYIGVSDNAYNRTSMAQSSLVPWKFIPNMSSSRVNHSTRTGANGDNLGTFSRSSIVILCWVYSLESPRWGIRIASIWRIELVHTTYFFMII